MLLFGNYVWFSGVGGFPATLLSDAAARGLHLFNTRVEGETLYACCPAAQYKYLRPLARRACMRLRITRKRGPYFRLFPYRRRTGIPVGLALAALLLCWLSGRIWIVQVETAAGIDEQAVLQAVAAQGVYPGCRIDTVDMQLLRLSALSDLQDTVYVSVNPSGCVARVTVNPRSMKPTVNRPTDGCANLVAAQSGRIVALEVYSGQAAVQVGDGVEAGMLLVSGTVEPPSGRVYLRRASGRVIAETTRSLQVTVPLQETVMQSTGKVIFTPYFRFLKWDIPLFSHIPPTQPYREITRFLLPRAGDKTLPIGLIDRRLDLVSPTVITRSAAQAASLAQTRMQLCLGALRAQGVEVLSTQSSVTDCDEKNAVLTVTLLCREDIAIQKPVKIADNSTESS